MRKVIGVLLIASPLIVVTALMVQSEGWMLAVGVWGAMALMAVVTWVGCWLIDSE